MPNLSVRNLDQEAYAALRRRAAANGRSMEAEARAVLEEVAAEPPVDRIALAAELKRRRRARTGGRRLPDSTPLIRQDRERR